MKKFLCVCSFATVTLVANAQFTTYQSVDPNIPQQRSTQSNSGYPFTIYESADPVYIRRNGNLRQHHNTTPQQQNQKTIRGIYLNPITNDAQYIKIQVTNYGNQQYAKAYYDATTNQWFQCNSQVLSLGIYDDA
ncbi:hypothetical protein EVD33_07435, partial [Bacteroidales bacterium SW292]|nr:hypothetical protein [Bacteroidales bacterium SW292]